MVSVIIPFYNTPPDLTRHGLESVVAQDVDDLEVVIVNDGSEPDSTRALESLVAEFSGRLNIRLFHQENAGAAHARNRAIQEASFDLIALLDSDDHWKHGKLRAQIDYLAAHPEAWLVCGASEVLDNSSGERRFRGGDELVRYFSGGHRRLYTRILAQNRVYNMTVCFRKQGFLAVGGYDPGLGNAHDADLFIRACRRGLEMHYLDLPMSVQVFHGGNISLRRERRRRCWLEILNRELHDPPEFLSELPAREIAPEMTRAWYKLGRYAAWNGNYSLAREAFGRSFWLRPSYRQALRYLGAWVEGLGFRRVTGRSRSGKG